MIHIRVVQQAALLIGACLSQAAVAADFKKSSLQVGGPDLIEVYGDLAFRDEQKFIDVAIGSAHAVVVFHSRGGNLFAGIEIGRAIRLKGFSTLVPDKMLCASACALAWLAGRVRFISDTGRVGFHAAYTDHNGQAKVSSAGNAVVGAYLNQLGLPTSAIVYITGTPPDGMQWLSATDAQRFGIDVKRLNLASRNPAPVPGQEPAPETLGGRASIEVVGQETQAFIAASNLQIAQSLAYLEGKYTDQVHYYGEVRAKATVIQDKRAFFQKWPRRSYLLKPGSLKISCSTQTRCEADGTVDWDASGASSRSVGSATFALVWTMEGGDWKLRAESSRVISRKVSRLPPSKPRSDGPLYHLDPSGRVVLALSNLQSADDCHPYQTSGKIVKREFGSDGLNLRGVVIEQEDGSRQFINVMVELDKADAVTKGWVLRGLQTLLIEGRSAVIDARACGASGRVSMLDGVR